MQPAQVVYISMYIVYIYNAQVYIAACLPTTVVVGVLLLANERCAGSATIYSYCYVALL